MRRFYIKVLKKRCVTHQGKKYLLFNSIFGEGKCEFIFRFIYYRVWVVKLRFLGTPLMQFLTLCAKKVSYKESQFFAHTCRLSHVQLVFFLATPMLINKGPSRKQFITQIVSLVVFWHERFITYIVQVLITPLFTKLSPYSLVSGHPHRQIGQTVPKSFYVWWLKSINGIWSSFK